MAPSENPGYDANNPPGSHSIPLQDLSRPPDTVIADGAGRRARRATIEDDVPGRQRSVRGIRSMGRTLSRRYERIAEDSPTGGDRRGEFDDFESVNLSQDTRRTSFDHASFHQSTVGLSFGPQPSRRSDSSTPYESQPRPSDDNNNYFGASEDSTVQDTAADHSGYLSASYDRENDALPLADPRYLQPISGATAPEATGQVNRNSDGGRSVRFAGSVTGSGSHLGDDLEDGLRTGRSSVRNSHRSATGRLSASPSPSSALSRASSMMRMVSQRVVNLSNEPEVIESVMRQKSVLKHARMDAPPSLPAMMEYAHDVASSDTLNETGPEKQPSRVRRKHMHPTLSPLRGKSLGIFSPDNRIRKWLCEVLVHPVTEPIILLLIVVQTILLAIESSVHSGRRQGWSSPGVDISFLVIFIIYTLELIARTIVSGFIINPEEYSTLDRSAGLRNAVMTKTRELFSLQRQPSTKKPADLQQMSIIRSFTTMQQQADEIGDSRQQQRIRLARRAFLRHSFNRLDFLAVVSYWIAFSLSVLSIDSTHHIFIFKMLSSLRILRLLALTSGTTVILRSLKKAAPLLVNVAVFIGFFWLLFAIIGVQSFKSSLRRTCVWIDPMGISNYTLNQAPDSVQFCGGHLVNKTGVAHPWIHADGTNGTTNPKGHLCPQGSLCIEGTNPYAGTVSFDDVLHSLELVFVLMSSNTFSDLLYYTTDSDYLAASLFFIAGFIFLSLWLVNLLVAVITSSFQVIREESKRSAFTTDRIDDIGPEDTSFRRVSKLKRLFNRTNYLWIGIITIGLIVQCLRSSSMSQSRKELIDNTESTVTAVLFIEICFRIGVDWRNFFKSKQNWVDLILAVTTMVMQIPPIRASGDVYAGLSIFQVLRVYRIVLAFSLTRTLIMTVFSNIVGLLNLIIFVFLITFLTSIFAVQLFRDQIPFKTPAGETTRTTFYNIYNSFLGMYQVLSSENWTTILYSATSANNSRGTAWISAAFFVMWFVLANFVVLNMFIAVIQESFDISEDEKRLYQVRAFLQQKQLSESSHGNLALSSIFKLGRDRERYRDPLDHGPAALEMLLKEAVVQDFLDETSPLRPMESQPPENPPEQQTTQPGFFARLYSKLTQRVLNRELNPFYSKLKFSRDHDELDPAAMAKEVLSAAEQRKRAQRQYLQRYPRYNVSLYLFTPSNPIRHFCQRMVGPGRGKSRIEGVDPYKPVWYLFSAFIYAAIVTMVLIACICTPLYQRTYFETHEPGIHNWFVWTDLWFAILFSVEAVIKVIADGFFWTPNAYFRGSWGFIDGIVLITLWVNVVAALYKTGDVSRVVGAFRALRALRLLNVSDSARETFHAVIVMGGWKVISAAFVSMSFLIPFAIYGLNIFNGQMKRCNDGDFGYDDLSHCVGEYKSSPFQWEVLAPRAVHNPFYSFDNFGSSLFILFQIVSQEGWTDVLWSAMSITGIGKQPRPFSSQANALFFVVFNLLGAVFVLTLFVSVFMRNYTEQTGVAFLTAEQRSWLELRKLLKQISPSKRSLNKDNNKLKAYCYRIAVKKHGKWARFITALLLIHLILLVLEFYPEVSWWERTRDALFLFLTLFYIANVIIRLVGLTWARFRRSSWDLYSVVSVSGTFITTLLALINDKNTVFAQLHKLFLVSIALLIIPRNNQLDQLFKTAAASLTSIGNLLATWFILFLVYAIALNQIFGLTKFGGTQTGNINFRSVPKALILLFRMSCGEGWNQVMEDFATMEPPYCTMGGDFYKSDCGSAAWARTLLISWNILSMYIFVSLFVSLIFESFSYVYQRSSGLYAISRDEIRRFKQAWSTFDPDGTGFISKEVFPRLLGELSGVFEMRIYEGDFTVGRILEDCRVNVRESEISHSRSVGELDLKKLMLRLSNLPIAETRKRRARLNAFYEEVLVSSDPERGISFTSCLMILAHYNVITDSKSLRLEEFLRRRARLQRVEEAVRRNVVVGFFNTLYWSRRFRQRIQSRHDSRLVSVPQFSVPEIYVEDEDGPLDEDQPERTSDDRSTRTSGSQDGSSSTRPRVVLPRIETNMYGDDAHRLPSPTHSDWGNFNPSLSPHLSEGPTTVPYDTIIPHENTGREHGHQRGDSSVSVQNVLDSFDHSVWGESIRRSFTRRRSHSSAGNE
ncbi:calcium-channel protein [Arthroderma uncinatum]|uniref:calcium-channel protein n=1 Tax=Arthroderma uncinatum TaxID=74035 RepID=UPI00144AC7B1|nr:calcium-channel protein [Arthroderma uncinatum]KAF3480166.1 calcium-channel protein [Arthroderma uncinatum]